VAQLNCGQERRLGDNRAGTALFRLAVVARDGPAHKRKEKKKKKKVNPGVD